MAVAHLVIPPGEALDLDSDVQELTARDAAGGVSVNAECVC